MTDYRALGDKLHRESIVIDGLSYLYTGPSTRLDPELFTATNATVPETYHNYTETISMVWKTRKMVADDPKALLVLTAEDILDAKRQGKYGIIMGFQHSDMFEMDLDRIGVFVELGVRVIQLTYNFCCYTGDGCLESPDGGLSRFGRQFVKEVGRQGAILDLSHGGMRTTMEAIEAAEVPPFFSHANPLALTKSQRNITDEQMKAVAQAGGTVGICTWAPICWKNKPQRPTTDDYVDHIEYAVDLVGIDHVSISTDSPCTDRQDLTAKHAVEFNATYPEVAGPYLEQVSSIQEDKHPEGIPGIADLRGITGCLLSRGYKPEDVKKLLGGNLLRVFSQVWR